MDTLYSDNQYIDDYLSDKLPVTERERFESRLESDTTFKLLYESRLKFSGGAKKESIDKKSPPSDTHSQGGQGVSLTNLIIACIIIIIFLLACYVAFKVL